MTPTTGEDAREWLAAWSLAIGAASGFVAALLTALIGDRVPPAHHGVAIGWARTLADSGQIAGPLVMGTLADAVGLSAPFIVGPILLAGAACQSSRHRNVAAPHPPLGGRDA